ncbi:MarR family transcriptional regulator [Phenylobacterium montanum]|uniref:MarR family transcriptional regulator n=1 Tax=Phenylobacterium montanum TaxID=2823693 RepID=A0A975G2U5_9CAUL|nr:MarR family transcriptional regulator [Caulobacter sp. S6]QUD89528.1 MarR family transcriptional regulator [Caulobacter sp. S6]
MSLDAERFMGLAGFRYALRQFVAASEHINRGAGITQQQYQAMLAVKTWPGESMSMKDLSEQLLLTHHAAVQLVDRLAKADLAFREPSLEDRRSVLVKLTPNGDVLLGELAAKHLEEMLRQEPLLTQSLKRLKRMGV